VELRIVTEPFLVVQPMFVAEILYFNTRFNSEASIVLEPTITCLISQPFLNRVKRIILFDNRKIKFFNQLIQKACRFHES
jgi:hypothetical protein